MMIYDEILRQLQPEVKSTYQQLTVHYRPSLRPYQQVSREFAVEFNKRMQRISLTPKFEVSQRKLAFVANDQGWSPYLDC
jgi:hypothetical protein